jgi:hypothetical protein
LVVNAADCARLIGMAESTFEKLAARRAWERDEIPPPLHIGSGSGQADRYGRRTGQRRWLVSFVIHWLERRIEDSQNG